MNLKFEEDIGMSRLFTSFTRKLKKMYQVGPRECMRIVSNRMMIRRFAQQHKQAALAKSAATTWDVFTKIHPMFILKKDIVFKDVLIEHVDREDIIECANNILKNKFRLFEQDIIFDGDARWHSDFLLKKEVGRDYSFDPEIYFDDVVISAGTTFERVKDIRVVWELSRLHFLMPLGKAYALTGNKEYVDYFQNILTDWLKHNPYLLGVNWVCPMEVGIRAINLIIGYSYFKDADIDEAFRQQYVCLLYDHMRFLEHTWEYYDGRTSNHYLSDLVGYFYLCFFFDKKTDWVIKEILSECEKQIAADGMSYEGSTAYHVLVTELFSLFQLLYEQESVALPQTFYQKFLMMCEAIAACKINDREMIMIGDNDSGKVLWTGISPGMLSKTRTNLPQERTDFEQFGLTVVKKEGWHLSLRHKAYQLRQPSGHFHNDVGSVTLALEGIPILVDPGSYCYTASVFWRNYFRSASVHNAVSLKGKEPVEFDERLFALNLSEVYNIGIRSREKTSILNSIYANGGFNFERNIQMQKNVVEITDIVFRSSAEIEDSFLFFNFTFAPGIILEKVNNGWLILYKNNPVCIFESELDFNIVPGWVSHNYGSKILAVRLSAEVLHQSDREYVCCFKRLF